MRRFLPFAALLGVVLVLGCQDLGPVGPDGLVPQFGGPAHPDPHGGGGDGDKTEAATYTVVHTGDITTFPVELTAIPHPGKPGSAIKMGHGEIIVLSDDFVSGVGVTHADALLCFPAEDFRLVGITIRRRKNGIEGQYVFSARGTDGTTPVNYNIHLTGGVTSGALFAPDPDEMTVVTWENATLGAQGESVESACAPAIVPLAPSGVTIDGHSQ